MEFKKKPLFEAKATDDEIKQFIATSTSMGHPFVKKWYENYAKVLKEASGDQEAGTTNPIAATGPYGDNALAAPGATTPASLEPESGAFRGQSLGDTFGAYWGLQVAPTMEIFNAVVRGFRRYMDDSFVRKYTTESTVFKIPLTEYTEFAADISHGAAITTAGGGQVPFSLKTVAYAVVDLTTPESEKGAKVSWTRNALEDVTFDMQAEMMEGLGHAIAFRIMKSIVAKLLFFDVDTTNLSTYAEGMPAADCLTVSDPITWAQFLAIVSAVDKGVNVTDADGVVTWRTYGPADYVLVSPDVYWQLLNIIQLTNVLYEGSTDPINAGKIKLALGCTIIKMGVLPAHTVVALNSEKALALVTRRQMKIEPVLFPVWNEYGFIATVRYGVTRLFSGAIQIGSTSATFPRPTDDYYVEGTTALIS